LWPPACRVLNCQERAIWPYPFTGGWGAAAQYALLLLFLLPAVGGTLIALLRAAGRRRWALPALGAVAGLALVAGGPLWVLLLAALGWYLLYRALGPYRGDPQRLLVRGLAACGLFAVVLVYGLEPGYLHRLGGNEAALPPVRVTLTETSPRTLSSEAATALEVTVRNTGWSALGGGASGPLTLGLRYLVTPQRGTTRTVDGDVERVVGTLAPGEARTVRVPVRLPPWVRGGYLTWHPHLANGSAVPLAARAPPGFRFINIGYRRLGLDPENQLTALAARARAFQAETRPAPPAEPDTNAVGMVVGDVLDTLFFSPLWGERELTGANRPFTRQRPLLLSLLHRYGLIGFALALWVAWRLLQRTLGCAERGDPAWMLMPLALVLLAAAGLFTPALGSYHSDWSFFLLSGFLEGRYARRFPWPSLRLAPRRPWRWRLPLPGRMGAPRRRHAGRVHR